MAVCIPLGPNHRGQEIDEWDRKKRRAAVKNGDFTNTCVLVPALVDILGNNTASNACAVVAANYDNNQMKDLPSSQMKSTATHRQNNPYQNILLLSISVIGEMVVLHAAVSSVDYSVVLTILFPFSDSGQQHHVTVIGCIAKPPDDNNGIVVNKTLLRLFNSIINIFSTYDVWWKDEFNTAATCTLMDVISNNSTYISLVNNMPSGIYLEAAECLMTLPSDLDAPRHDIWSRAMSQMILWIWIEGTTENGVRYCFWSQWQQMSFIPEEIVIYQQVFSLHVNHPPMM